MDPRVKAAAIASFITSFKTLMPGNGPQDAEQTLPRFIASGLDFADWVELAAPRPVAIVAFETDFFPIAGARQTYEEARRFYSLFGAVYHRRYGVPGLQLATPRKALSDNARRGLRAAVQQLSDVLSQAQDDQPIAKGNVSFVNASTRQTDNIQPRRTRRSGARPSTRDAGCASGYAVASAAAVDTLRAHPARRARLARR
jgi:hypothetical protein